MTLADGCHLVHSQLLLRFAHHQFRTEQKSERASASLWQQLMWMSQTFPSLSAASSSIRNKAPFEVTRLAQKMYIHLLKRRSLRQTNQPARWAGAVLVKAGEWNVHVKTDVISTYSEAESKIPIFPLFSNKELVFRRGDTCYLILQRNWLKGGSLIQGLSLSYTGAPLLNIHFSDLVMKYSNRYLSDILFWETVWGSYSNRTSQL